MTHLRRELEREEKTRREGEIAIRCSGGGASGGQMGTKSAAHHSVHRHLGCCHRKSHWCRSLRTRADERSSSGRKETADFFLSARSLSTQAAVMLIPAAETGAQQRRALKKPPRILTNGVSKLNRVVFGCFQEQRREFLRMRRKTSTHVTSVDHPILWEGKEKRFKIGGFFMLRRKLVFVHFKYFPA